MDVLFSFQPGNDLRRHFNRSRSFLGRLTVCLAATGLALALATGAAAAQDLSTFAVLAGSTITNTGPTTIHGNIGVYPGSAITGFPPGLVRSGAIFDNDAVAQLAQTQLTTLYNVLAGRPATRDLTGLDLGGLILNPGVYNFDNSAGLNGTLTLNGLGNPNAVFIFNIGSALTTGSGSTVTLVNGAQGGNVFFRVGSSATLGTASTFNGEIVALTAITLTTDADIICGAALARNAAVTLDTNIINVCALPAVTITPSGPTTAPITAIDEFLADNGTLPLGFAALGLLTPNELAAAEAELAGEIGATAEASALGEMNSFLDLMLGDRSGPGTVVLGAPDKSAPARGTVSVMDYGDEGSPVANAAFSSFDHGPAGLPPDRRMTMWVAGYGDYSTTSGDVAAGTHDGTDRDLGLVGGIDYRVSGDSRIGFSVGSGTSNFGLSDSLGSGSMVALQAGAYGRKDIGDAYLRGALGYGYDLVSTTRTITIGGSDTLDADFAAQDVAAQVEAGYQVGWLTPYLGVRGQVLMSPAYSETASTGVSTFALDYAARTLLTARTEVGVRAGWTTDLNDGATLGLHAGIAWAHDFWSDAALEAEFEALPGATFAVSGATPAADSLLLSASMDFATPSGFTLAGALNAELALNSRSYGGKLRLGYSW